MIHIEKAEFFQYAIEKECVSMCLKFYIHYSIFAHNIFFCECKIGQSVNASWA